MQFTQNKITQLVVKEIENSNLSLKEISDASGVTQQTLKKWVNGETKSGLISTASIILKVLGKKFDIVDTEKNAGSSNTPATIHRFAAKAARK